MPYKNSWNCMSRESTIIQSHFIKQFLLNEMALNNCAVVKQINEMSGDLKQQLKAVLSRFEHFASAISKTVDITELLQLAVFIRACDCEFNIYEELIELVPMHDTTRQDIFEKVKQVLHGYGFDLSKFSCLSIDG